MAPSLLVKAARRLAIQGHADPGCMLGRWCVGDFDRSVEYAGVFFLVYLSVRKVSRARGLITSSG